MNIKLIETPSGAVAVIHSDMPIITDTQSALDCMVNAGAYLIAINKEAITEEFFKLSTGMAGGIVQKFVNYGYRLAIIGDFSRYTSKPLRDYIYECNQGRHLYFVLSEEEAVKKLGAK